MPIKPSNLDSVSLSGSKGLKPSHRTRPEQGVGLALFLFICLGFAALAIWLGKSEAPDMSRARAIASSEAAWLSYYALLALSVWTLWRRFSLRVLKLEATAFFAQFVFQTGWCVSFFTIGETLPALALLLILFCNHLLTALLFWKKERVSGQLLFLPIIWIFYLMGVNMVTCIFNP